MLWRVDKTIDDQLCGTRAPYAQSQVSLITLSVINIIIISSVDLSWFAAHGKNSKASTVCSFPSLPFSTPTLSSWRSQLRDELRMTLLAFQTLYESSIAFGIRWIQFNMSKKNDLHFNRKALRAEHGKAEMESMISQLESAKTRLEKEVLTIMILFLESLCLVKIQRKYVNLSNISSSESWNHFVWRRFRGTLMFRWPICACPVRWSRRKLERLGSRRRRCCFSWWWRWCWWSGWVWWWWWCGWWCWWWWRQWRRSGWSWDWGRGLRWHCWRKVDIWRDRFFPDGVMFSEYRAKFYVLPE